MATINVIQCPSCGDWQPLGGDNECICGKTVYESSDAFAEPETTGRVVPVDLNLYVRFLEDAKGCDCEHHGWYLEDENAALRLYIAFCDMASRLVVQQQQRAWNKENRAIKREIGVKSLPANPDAKVPQHMIDELNGP